MSLRAVFLLWSSCTALLLVGPRALADVRVTRDADADTCPEPSAFEERVREGVASSRDISVQFKKAPVGYTSIVRTADGMERALDDPACAALADATLVIVKLALDVPSHAPEPTPSAPRASTTALARERPDAPAAARGAAVELLAGGTAAAGLGAPFAPGARVSALLYLGRWGVGVTGVTLATQSRELDRGVVDVGVLGGGVEGCGRVGDRALSGALCSRVELLRLAGSARGFTRNEEHARPLPTVGLVARGQLRVARPFGLFAELGGAFPLSRERFAIEGAGIVYDPPVVAGIVTFGGVATFE